MVASTDIKVYVHTNTNAPQLQNAYGSMINVLDACLVNGFGSQAVATLTASGMTVTATFGSAHKFMQYQVIKIVGAAQTEYNGEHRILTVPDANTLTFELAAVPSVTTATGTINCSLPPLGWEKPFSATGKAAYRSTSTLLSSRPFLRVVDELDPAYTATYSKYAKVGIVEDMTDIDTMLGVQAPYDNANPNKNWVGTNNSGLLMNGWAKWYYAIASDTEFDDSAVTNGNRSYIVVGNSDYFYIVSKPDLTTAYSYGFGSFKTLLNADSSNTFLSSTLQYEQLGYTYLRGQNTALASISAGSKLLVQRGYSQLSNSIQASVLSLNSILKSGSEDYFGAYNLTNISPFIPVFINESVLRGGVPNLYWLGQNKPFNDLQLIESKGGLFIALNVKTHDVAGQIILKIGDL